MRNENPHLAQRSQFEKPPRNPVFSSQRTALVNVESMSNQLDGALGKLGAWP